MHWEREHDGGGELLYLNLIDDLGNEVGFVYADPIGDYGAYTTSGPGTEDVRNIPSLREAMRTCIAICAAYRMNYGRN